MRGLLALLLALAALVAYAGPGRPQDSPTEAPPDPRQERAALLLRIAELTDRLGTAEAEAVATRLRDEAAAREFDAVRRRAVERAVAAYVMGRATGAPSWDTRRLYVEVAVRKEQETYRRMRGARSEAAAARQEAEQARDELRLTHERVEEARTILDEALVATDLARRDAESLQADQARSQAMAAQSQALADARGRLAAGLPAGIDPVSLTPRHRRATEQQLAVMARYPFGRLPPGGEILAGLRPTGQQVTGLASWYGPGFNGRATASGAIYDQEGWTVASPTLPFGTFLVVRRGPLQVLLLVNDRGPYVGGRVLDLSHAAAQALGVSGVAPVTADIVVPA